MCQPCLLRLYPHFGLCLLSVKTWMRLLAAHSCRCSRWCPWTCGVFKNTVSLWVFAPIFCALLVIRCVQQCYPLILEWIIVAALSGTSICLWLLILSLVWFPVLVLLCLLVWLLMSVMASNNSPRHPLLWKTLLMSVWEVMQWLSVSTAMPRPTPPSSFIYAAASCCYNTRWRIFHYWDRMVGTENTCPKSIVLTNVKYLYSLPWSCNYWNYRLL